MLSNDKITGKSLSGLTMKACVCHMYGLRHKQQHNPTLNFSIFVQTWLCSSANSATESQMRVGRSQLYE